MNVNTQDFKTLPLPKLIELVNDIWDSIAEKMTAKPFFVAEDVDVFSQSLAAHQKDPASSASWDEMGVQLFKVPR